MRHLHMNRCILTITLCLSHLFLCIHGDPVPFYLTTYAPRSSQTQDNYLTTEAWKVELDHAVGGTVSPTFVYSPLMDDIPSPSSPLVLRGDTAIYAPSRAAINLFHTTQRTSSTLPQGLMYQYYFVSNSSTMKFPVSDANITCTAYDPVWDDMFGLSAILVDFQTLTYNLSLYYYDDYDEYAYFWSTLLQYDPTQSNGLELSSLPCAFNTNARLFTFYFPTVGDVSYSLYTLNFTLDGWNVVATEVAQLVFPQPPDTSSRSSSSSSSSSSLQTILGLAYTPSFEEYTMQFIMQGYSDSEDYGIVVGGVDVITGACALNLAPSVVSEFPLPPRMSVRSEVMYIVEDQAPYRYVTWQIGQMGNFNQGSITFSNVTHQHQPQQQRHHQQHADHHLQHGASSVNVTTNAPLPRQIVGVLPSPVYPQQ